MDTTAPRVRPWSSSPSGGFASIPHRRLHPGRCRRMRQCSQGDGCTSSRSAGSTRSTKAIPRWPSSSGHGATRRLASSPTPSYCASDSGLSRGFTHYDDFIFPEFTALKMAVLVNRVLLGLGNDRAVRGGSAIARRVAALCASGLAVTGLRSQGRRDGQPRVPRLAVASGRSRSGRFSRS